MIVLSGTVTTFAVVLTYREHLHGENGLWPGPGLWPVPVVERYRLNQSIKNMVNIPFLPRRAR